MASRYEMEVKLISARGMKNVNWRHGPNRPYVVVWVDPSRKLSTHVDETGDTDADWNQTLTIPLPPQPLEDQTLCIDVVHAGSEDDTKPLIGSARLKLTEPLEEGIGSRLTKHLTLKRPSGRPHGKVQVSVCIRDPGYRAQEGYPAPAYGLRDYSPAPQGYGGGGGGGGYQYGAPQQGGGYYSAGPPAGYPYSAAPYGQGYNGPPQTASYGQGYGAGPQTASYGQGSGAYAYAGEEKKKSKFGGMGTGLAVGAVAGVLGGIALVEGAEYVEDKIADDVADKVEDDLGYDADDF